MTPDQVRALARRFFESQDERKGGADPALLSSDYQAQINGMPPMDAAAHAGMAAQFYSGLTGAQHHIEQVMADGDRAAVRFVFTGTHDQPLFGMPPSGKAVEVPAHIFLLIKDGKVARVTGLFDEAGMLRQIGVLPMPG